MLTYLTIFTIVQTCITAILCLGFTFTYSTEKFPNFAHISIANIGAAMTFGMVRVLGFNPYNSLPIAVILCGFLGVLFYIFVTNPLKRLGGWREVTLTLASLAVSRILYSFFIMFSYWSTNALEYKSNGFRVVEYDFMLYDLPGIVFFAPIASLALMVVFYIFMTRNRHGIALRAVAEDEHLAASIGVNTLRVHLTSWFLAGGLAGFAGVMLTLWRGADASSMDELLIVVMAGSFLGGINSIYGSVLGGILIAFSKWVLPGLANGFLVQYSRFFETIGFPFSIISSLLPIAILCIIMFVEPEGIVGYLKRPNRRFQRIMDILKNK